MFKKIDAYVGEAHKINGKGTIEFTLWVDSSGSFYIQMISNELSGTFTTHVIPVKKYASLRNSESAIGSIEVVDLINGERIKVQDNNNGAFLKAVLRDIIPDDQFGGR